MRLRWDGIIARLSYRSNFFGHKRLRPETGFELHCVAELAVQLAKFSAWPPANWVCRARTTAPVWHGNVRFADAPKAGERVNSSINVMSRSLRPSWVCASTKS